MRINLQRTYMIRRALWTNLGTLLCMVIVSSTTAQVNQQAMDKNKARAARVLKMLGNKSKGNGRGKAPQILFSKSVEDIDNNNFITEFEGTDNIYAHVDLGAPIESLFRKNFYLTGFDLGSWLQILVDPAEFGLPLLAALDVDGNQSTLTVPILVDSGLSDQYNLNEYGVKTQRDHLIGLGSGQHEIKTTLQSPETGQIFEGSFTVNQSEGSIAAVESKSAYMLEWQRSRVASNATLPAPGRLQQNAEQVTEFASFFKDYTGNEPLKIVVTGDEWGINRSEYTDQITDRTLYAVIAWQDSPGKCKMGTYYIEELYMSGRWGDKRFSGSSSDEYSGPIACDKLK